MNGSTPRLSIPLVVFPLGFAFGHFIVTKDVHFIKEYIWGVSLSKKSPFRTDPRFTGPTNPKKTYEYLIALAS